MSAVNLLGTPQTVRDQQAMAVDVHKHIIESFNQEWTLSDTIEEQIYPDETPEPQIEVNATTSKPDANTTKPKSTTKNPTRASQVLAGDTRRMLSSRAGQESLTSNIQASFTDVTTGRTYYNYQANSAEIHHQPTNKIGNIFNTLCNSVSSFIPSVCYSMFSAASTLETVIYNMPNVKTDSQDTLADGGYNGSCVNGKDWRIIDFVPNRRVNVTGLNNHQVTGNRLCSAGSVVESFNGSKQDVILIVNQAAHIPTSNSILSNVQMRAHGCKVDDTSIEHKGEQCITTSGGYKIPLSIRNGLAYVKGRPYTDEEWLTLPKIEITSDNVWDPSKLNNDFTVDDLMRSPIELPKPTDLQFHPDYDLEGQLI